MRLRIQPFVPALILALFCTACAGRITMRDVRRSFTRDEAALRPALPTSRNILALRMEDKAAMARTLELGEAYREQGEDLTLNGDVVTALLCCSYLCQGRVAEAYDLAQTLTVRGSHVPPEDRLLVKRVKWLASACHALAGHQAVVRMETEESGEVQFLERWGSLAGFPLPRRTARDYLQYLGEHAIDMRRTCFPPEPRSPVQLDARSQRFWELRRTLAEQFYNDSAALLENLRPVRDGTNAEDRFFAIAVSSLYISISYLSDDLIPRVKISPAQKQWMREQSLSTFDLARDIARHYVTDARAAALEDGLVPKPNSTPLECRDRLYARLFVAQKEVLYWITIQTEEGSE